MQNGSVIRRARKKHSDIWQFRWWEKTPEGNRVYRRRVIGTVEQIPDLEAARKAARLLVPDLNAKKTNAEPSSMTLAQLCSHFDQRIMHDQHLAQLLNQEHLQGLPETLGHSGME